MSFRTDKFQNFNGKQHSQLNYISFKCFIVIVNLLFALSCCTAFTLLKINTLHNEVAHLKHTVENMSSLLHEYKLLGRQNIFFNESNVDGSNEYVNEVQSNTEEGNTNIESNPAGLSEIHTNGIRSKRFVYSNGYSDHTYKSSTELTENSTTNRPPLPIRLKNRRRQENQEDTPSTPEMKDPLRRHRQRHRAKIELAEEINFPVKQHEQGKLLVAHFSGDTSKYIMGQHANFNGNGHLQHPEKTYVDWIRSDWVHGLGMDQLYRINNGYVTIKEAGLYLIYAQIYYLDAHDTNGYKVYVNGNAILQCTTMTHSESRIVKGNTCFTSGVEYVNDGDLLSVADLSDGRYSLFEKGKSFFGIVKLSDLKMK